MDDTGPSAYEVAYSLDYIERTVAQLRAGSHPAPIRAAHLLGVHAALLMRAAEHGDLGPFS